MWLWLQILGVCLDPFKAPEPLPILNPSNFDPKNGFPVEKGVNPFGATKNPSLY